MTILNSIRAGLWLGTLACIGGVAQAADAPLVTPLVDSDVTYRMTAPNGSVMHQRMRWSARHWRQRLDIDGAATYMVSDYKTHVMVVFDRTHQTATVSGSPSASFLAPGTPAGGVWRKTGSALQVAGQSCTVWESEDTDRQAADVCYTDDGLLLQATRGGAVMLTAQAVSRDAISDEIFAVPSGFRFVRQAPQ